MSVYLSRECCSKESCHHFLLFQNILLLAYDIRITRNFVMTSVTFKCVFTVVCCIQNFLVSAKPHFRASLIHAATSSFPFVYLFLNFTQDFTWKRIFIKIKSCKNIRKGSKIYCHRHQRHDIIIVIIIIMFVVKLLKSMRIEFEKL